MTFNSSNSEDSYKVKKLIYFMIDIVNIKFIMKIANITDIINVHI